MARETAKQPAPMLNEHKQRPIEIRQGDNAMLTFAEITDVNLDPFFNAVVELLLERLEQLKTSEKEI